MADNDGDHGHSGGHEGHHSGPGHKPAVGVWQCLPNEYALEFNKFLAFVVWTFWLVGVVLFDMLAAYDAYGWTPSEFKSWLGPEKLVAVEGVTVAATLLGSFLFLRQKFIDARRDRSKRSKDQFHVSVLIKKGANDSLTATIASATKFLSRPLTGALSDTPLELTEEQAAPLQHVLPALYRLQEATGGLLKITTNKSERKFQSVQEFPRDVFRKVAAPILIGAGVLVTAVGWQSKEWGAVPPWVGGAMFAVGAILGLNALLRASYRRFLTNTLHVTLKFRPNSNIVDVVSNEHLSWRFGNHEQWAVLHHSHGLGEFCVRLARMEENIRLKWELVAEEKSMFGAGAVTHAGEPSQLDDKGTKRPSRR
ncbi:MAG: hypothetical protein GC190_07640 [Alphaproteobacteria bacterium]|nr:hypothetical protein [Alphaproteobacteria bacterium]